MFIYEKFWGCTYVTLCCILIFFRTIFYGIRQHMKKEVRLMKCIFCISQDSKAIYEEGCK
jgi:hypothetical protein